MEPKLNREQLRLANHRVWRRAILTLRSSRRWQTAIKIVLILAGSVLGAFGGALEGPLLPNSGDGFVTLKGLLVILGGGMAFTGGALLLAADENLPELLSDARSLAESARVYLDERDSKDRQLAEYEALDRRRRSLIAATNQMREAIEQALFNELATIETAAQFMLDTSVSSIQAAIGLEAGELWSISIFRIEGAGDDRELRRIAVVRADRSSERTGARTWKRNEGFIGAAWHSGRDVVIADSTDPLVIGDYTVPIEKRRDYDGTRYRALALIPVRVGDQQVWGVVAASSNVQGRFRRDPTNYRAQNVDSVRTVARMTAILAAALAGR